MTDAKPSPLLDSCNPIPADLADWTQAPFPVHVDRGGGGSAILLCAVGVRVVGFTYWCDRPEDCDPLALSWHLDGGHGGPRSYPSSNLDLPPPPAVRAQEADRLRAAIAEIQQRLDAHPDAPEAWRAQDLNKSTQLQAQLQALEESL